MNGNINIFSVAIIIAIVIFLSYRIINRAYIRFKTANEISKVVTGKVIEKSHVYGSSVSPEEFLVRIKWKEIEQRFNDKDIYSRYNVGSQIKLVLTTKYDKNNVILEQVLKPKAWVK